MRSFGSSTVPPRSCLRYNSARLFYFVTVANMDEVSLASIYYSAAYLMSFLKTVTYLIIVGFSVLSIPDDDLNF